MVEVSNWKIIWDAEFVKQKKTDKDIMEELKANLKRLSTGTPGIKKPINNFFFYGFIVFICVILFM